MSQPLAFAAAEIAGLASPPPGGRPGLSRILSAVRKHMGMEVAFISQITDGQRFFRHVDAGDSGLGILPGGSDPIEDSYCIRVIDGRLPELMTNACVNLEALTLPVTRALPVGAHLSVPIRLADGEVYGTFCCFSRSPDETLTERDLSVMRVFAEMVGDQIQQDLDDLNVRHLVDNRIDGALKSDALQMVYQPIVDVTTNCVVGFESLARFMTEPYRTPDTWFVDAASVGRAVELETIAIRKALIALALFPPSVYLTVNASPDVIINGDLAGTLRGLPLDRVVVEVTEHQVIEKYEDIAEVMAPLQKQGLRIAIDDAGAGYASFRHVVNLHPEIVKLDISITRGIDCDRSRRALAAALCGFAAETGCSIVAEGVETEGELAVIKALGITKVQGYHLGRPLNLAASRQLIDVQNASD